MSFFGKMFGAKKEPTMTTGEAIQKLRETENMLLKKQDFLEKKIELELAEAKKNGTKNKRGNTVRRNMSGSFSWKLRNYPTPCFSFVVSTEHLFSPATLETIFQPKLQQTTSPHSCLRLRIKQKSNESYKTKYCRSSSRKWLLDDCFYRLIHCNDRLHS